MLYIIDISIPLVLGYMTPAVVSRFRLSTLAILSLAGHSLMEEYARDDRSGIVSLSLPLSLPKHGIRHGFLEFASYI